MFLMDWMVSYVDTASRHAATPATPAHATPSAYLDHSTSGRSSASSHRSFFSICQATMYTVCFHAAALHMKTGGVEFLASLPWRHVLLSALHPLNHCLQVPVCMFAGCCAWCPSFTFNSHFLEPVWLFACRVLWRSSRECVVY